MNGQMAMGPYAMNGQMAMGPWANGQGGWNPYAQGQFCMPGSFPGTCNQTGWGYQNPWMLGPGMTGLPNYNPGWNGNVQNQGAFNSQLMAMMQAQIQAEQQRAANLQSVQQNLQAAQQEAQQAMARFTSLQQQLYQISSGGYAYGGAGFGASFGIGASGSFGAGGAGAYFNSTSGTGNIGPVPGGQAAPNPAGQGAFNQGSP